MLNLNNRVPNKFILSGFFERVSDFEILKVTPPLSDKKKRYDRVHGGLHREPDDGAGEHRVPDVWPGCL